MAPGELILIGSGGLLWHAAQRGITEPLPENSMAVDPITDSDEVAERCYDTIIGSEFEQRHGWHVNLMPSAVLRESPLDWETRASTKAYDQLRVSVPSSDDLLVPKKSAMSLATARTKFRPGTSPCYRLHREYACRR